MKLTWVFLLAVLMGVAIQIDMSHGGSSSGMDSAEMDSDDDSDADLTCDGGNEEACTCTCEDHLHDEDKKQNIKKLKEMSGGFHHKIKRGFRGFGWFLRGLSISSYKRGRLFKHFRKVRRAFVDFGVHINKTIIIITDCAVQQQAEARAGSSEAVTGSTESATGNTEPATVACDACDSATSAAATSPAASSNALPDVTTPSVDAVTTVADAVTTVANAVTGASASSQAATESVTGASSQAATESVTGASSQAATESVTGASSQAATESVTGASSQAATETPVATDVTGAVTDAVSDVSGAVTDAVSDVSGSSDAATESITDVSGSSDAATESITDVSGSSDAATESITDVSGSSDAATESITDVSGSSDADTESITDVSGSSDAATESITDVSGSSDAATESITDVSGSSDAVSDAIESATESSAEVDCSRYIIIVKEMWVERLKVLIGQLKDFKYHHLSIDVQITISYYITILETSAQIMINYAETIQEGTYTESWEQLKFVFSVCEYQITVMNYNTNVMVVSSFAERLLCDNVTDANGTATTNQTNQTTTNESSTEAEETPEICTVNSTKFVSYVCNSFIVSYSHGVVLWKRMISLAAVVREKKYDVAIENCTVQAEKEVSAECDEVDNITDDAYNETCSREENQELYSNGWYLCNGDKAVYQGYCKGTTNYVKVYTQNIRTSWKTWVLVVRAFFRGYIIWEQDYQSNLELYDVYVKKNVLFGGRVGRKWQTLLEGFATEVRGCQDENLNSTETNSTTEIGDGELWNDCTEYIKEQKPCYKEWSDEMKKPGHINYDKRVKLNTMLYDCNIKFSAYTASTKIGKNWDKKSSRMYTHHYSECEKTRSKIRDARDKCVQKRSETEDDNDD